MSVFAKIPPSVSQAADGVRKMVFSAWDFVIELLWAGLHGIDCSTLGCK